MSGSSSAHIEARVRYISTELKRCMMTESLKEEWRFAQVAIGRAQAFTQSAKIRERT